MQFQAVEFNDIAGGSQHQGSDFFLHGTGIDPERCRQYRADGQQQ